MRKTAEQVMERFGTELTIHHGEETKTLRGFFRAVNSQSWQSLESVVSPLGETSRGQYAYLGPASGGVQEGDTLTLGEKTYLFRRTELYFFRQEAIYQWGLCVEKGVNDTWGCQS